MKAPLYEALDGNGLSYTRPAQTVGELPTPEERGRALEDATMQVAKALGTAAQRRIGFGTPVHVAFGLSRQQAKNHPQAKLLLTKGDDLPLRWCSLYGD